MTKKILHHIEKRRQEKGHGIQNYREIHSYKKKDNRSEEHIKGAEVQRN